MLRHHSEQLSIPWGEMSIKEKDFILGGESKSSKAKGPDFVFGIILTHLLMTKGEDKHFEGSNDSVFGDSCQRGRKYEPKAKGPHHHLILKLMIFKLVSYCVRKREKVVFSKLIS